MMTPEQIQNKEGVLRLDSEINRIQLAASYLRNLAVALEGQQSIESLTLRLKAQASELARLATELAERTGRVLPAEIDTTASLETALAEEDPEGIFKVWVHLEFHDMGKGHFQDLGDFCVEPKCAGSFTSLRQAMEQAHSLQGRFGGIELYEHDLDELTGWNALYIKRHVRVNAIDPMSRFLIDAGVPHCPEYDDPNPDSPNVWVFAFPLKAPETAWINDGVGATQMLENWLAFKRHYTEHNPSITVYVRPEEWINVGNWVYEHWDEVGGLAFLPKDDHVYPLAPIKPLTEEEFASFERSFPQIPWETFPRYEQGCDYVPEISRDYACIAGACQF